VHGATYEDHPVASAAALKVQQIVEDEKLVDNVRRQGAMLLNLLQQRIGSHPCVSHIRGRGLFWGVSRDSSSTHMYVVATDEARSRLRSHNLGLTNLIPLA
jgi:adenosylmethionine-8-amino-7-oxononanoate aminotransferase